MGKWGRRRGSEALGKTLKENALSSSFQLSGFNLNVASTGKPLHVLPRLAPTSPHSPSEGLVHRSGGTHVSPLLSPSSSRLLLATRAWA